MKKLILIFSLVCAVSVGLVCSTLAQQHVRGYTRKDGTVVQSYDRNSPRGGGNNSGSTYYPAPYYTTPSYPAPSYTTPSTYYAAPSSIVSSHHYSSSGYVGARDTKGRIVRSAAAKERFMRMTGYPHGRPGYVVDHIIALKRGGADDSSNMQWQTIAEGKAKDKWE